MSQVQVVAAILCQESKFLLGKRAHHKKSAPGFWSPISGRIEAGESETEAVVRECFEEIGLEVQPQRKLAQYDIDGGKARLHAWLVDAIGGQAHLKNDEHTELRWFSLSEIKQEKNMLEPDREVFLSLGSKLSQTPSSPHLK
jgi:8-oxo-dGTP pyrophosphatase MutT (NUDIX family)